MRGLAGRLTAQLWLLRQMSSGIVRRLEAGEDVAIDASIVKDLGCDFEQESPRAIQGDDGGGGRAEPRG